MSSHITKGRDDRGFTQVRTSKTRGFTLIELLVVIAIIGLLSSVVLASLNSARNKGADAAIKSQLKSLQSQAEIIYDNSTPNGYENVCEDTNVMAQVTSAGNAGGATTINFADATPSAHDTTAVCHDSDDNYAIEVPLKTTNTQSWCVDSNGPAKATTSVLPADTYLCP